MANSKYANYTPPELDLPATQGIISVESDPTAFDILKVDPLRGEYDPQSEEASKRVASYYKNYGIAMMPEEAAEFNQRLSSTRERAASARESLLNYGGKFQESLAGAEREGQALIAGIKSPNISGQTMPTEIVRVVDASGKNVEASYRVPVGVAAKLSDQKGLYTTGTPQGFNISVRAKGGKIIGQEIHDALREAAQQTDAILAQQSRALSSAKETAAIATGAARENAIREMESGKETAVNAFDQAYGQGLEAYFQIGQQWGQYLSGKKEKEIGAKQAASEAIAKLKKPGLVGVSAKKE